MNLTLGSFLHSKWSLELSQHYPKYTLLFAIIATAINYTTYALAIIVFMNYIDARNALNAKLLKEITTPTLSIPAGIGAVSILSPPTESNTPTPETNTPKTTKMNLYDKISYYINMQFIKNWKIRVAQWIIRDIAILIFFVWLTFFAHITIFATATSHQLVGNFWINKTVNGSMTFT